MHIVYLVHAFPAFGEVPAGGAGSYYANMAQIMHKNGHKVSVITEASEDKEYDWNGIKVYHVNIWKIFPKTNKDLPVMEKFLRNIERSYYYNKKVRQIHKVNPIDIVQSINFRAIPLLRSKEIPYIIRLSDDPYIWYDANVENFNYYETITKKRIDIEMQYWALKKANALISPSYMLRNRTYEKIKIEPKVVESPVLIKDTDIISFNEEGLEPNKYFLTFGGMVYRKEIHILANIIDILLDKYPDMKYVMAGWNRRLRNKEKCFSLEFLERYITKNRDRFVFLDEVEDRGRLFSIVKNARACILPTRVDNLPNTILEAMALGKIIVSSTSEYGTSVEQLITDGESGFLAQVDDEEALLCKIDQAMSLSQEKKQTIEQKAKDRVKDLTPEKVYKKMIDIYQEVIEKHRN